MPMVSWKAGELLQSSGPRFYFLTNSVSGSGDHLDHELWRLPGVRFTVHAEVLPVGGSRSAADTADDLINNIQAFVAAFRAAQPAGTPLPSYAVQLAVVGGAFAWADFAGHIPVAAANPQDALAGYVNGFTFTPPPGVQGYPQTGTVSTTTSPPTTSALRIASGTVYNRPDGGLERNRARLTSGSASADGERNVLTWVSNVATLQTSLMHAPVTGDDCLFITPELPTCYRFTQGRADLSLWSDEFFDQLDANWPSGLERPEILACSTEELGQPDTAWHPAKGWLAAYLAADPPDPISSDLSLSDWKDSYGTDLNGSAITLPTDPTYAFRSPQAQDYRSLSTGAFMIGMAWTWQLSFVDRMKRTWPGTRFVHYLLTGSSKRSPTRTQPGEFFYHGDPWPPDVALSPDYYDNILNLVGAAYAIPGTVDGPGTAISFKVAAGSAFLGQSVWATGVANRLRFDEGTSTPGLGGATATITSWDSTNQIVHCSPLPAVPGSGDTFVGYYKASYFSEWETYHIGWSLWAAFKAVYAHAGTLEEIYRHTCVSWVLEAASRSAAAWPDRDVIPFVARTAELFGPHAISDEAMYPDPALQAPPGYQTRADWGEMLSGMMDVGVGRTVVFEPQAATTGTLDAWVEILGGVREFYNNHHLVYETIAPQRRNRDWRRRHLWRS